MNKITNKHEPQDEFNIFPKAESKVVIKKNKMHTPAIRTLLKVGEELASRNKADKEALRVTEDLIHRVQQRTDAHMKDFYKELRKD